MLTIGLVSTNSTALLLSSAHCTMLLVMGVNIEIYTSTWNHYPFCGLFWVFHYHYAIFLDISIVYYNYELKNIKSTIFDTYRLFFNFWLSPYKYLILFHTLFCCFLLFFQFNFTIFLRQIRTWLLDWVFDSLHHSLFL